LLLSKSTKLAHLHHEHFVLSNALCVMVMKHTKNACITGHAIQLLW